MFETKNLFLKQFANEDLNEMIRFFQDENFMAFSPNGVLNNEDAKARFFEIIEHYKKYGFGKLAIVSKKTNKIIGYCGFEICTINGKQEAELGFRLSTNERGQGYIVEAATTLIEDMKARNFKQVVAFSEEQNYPAHNLLSKLGFIKTFTSNYLNMDAVFFKKDL
ncbi:GNAT family N-acetyltransferase [Acinetobacter sp. ESBL14]|uniref:GNAT family N-acetyltransferase n=1 Tax=Acinetobacter sp. ESBL14 TaxID=3077329 RepID=UPI002FC63963